MVGYQEGTRKGTKLRRSSSASYLFSRPGSQELVELIAGPLEFPGNMCV